VADLVRQRLANGDMGIEQCEIQLSVGVQQGLLVLTAGLALVQRD
jgi:hypothetical protein